MTHELTISWMDWVGLRRGDKRFLVIPDTQPKELHTGDVLILHPPTQTATMVRWVRYLESGAHLRPDWVAVEVAP